jgi:hypothetical protein
MKLHEFLFESVWQVVTWVCIGLSAAFLVGHFFKGNNRGIMWSVIFLTIFILLMLGMVADRVWFDSVMLERDKQKTPQTIVQHPYVFVKGAWLEITPNKEPIFVFMLVNSGTIEAVGSIRDVSFSYTIDAGEHLFPYQAGKSLDFQLAPTDLKTVRAPMELIMTDDRIQALDEQRARFIVYARGEYREESGKSYPLNLCYMYNKDVPDKLVICPSDIEIK